MDEKRKKAIHGLKEVLIYLAICCYSPDLETQKKIQRMAENINTAIEILMGEEEA